MSKYAGRSGNSCSWGEKIIPMTYEDARAWCEKHIDADGYIAVFGEPEEEEGEKFDLHAVISAASGKKLKQQASQKGLSISAYLDTILSEI